MAPLLSSPPATTTLPFGRKVAVCPSRALRRLPVTAHLPLAAKANAFRTSSKAAAITIMGMVEFVMRSFISCLLKDFDPGFIAGRPDAQGMFYSCSRLDPAMPLDQAIAAPKSSRGEPRQQTRGNGC